MPSIQKKSNGGHKTKREKKKNKKYEEKKDTRHREQTNDIGIVLKFVSVQARKSEVLKRNAKSMVLVNSTQNVTNVLRPQPHLSRLERLEGILQNVQETGARAEGTLCWCTRQNASRSPHKKQWAYSLSITMEGEAKDKVRIEEDTSEQRHESFSVDEQTPVICIAPIKIKEEFNQDLEGQPLMKTDATNIGDSPHPTIFQSTDVPYPMELVENKFHTHVDKSAAEQSSASMTIEDLPDALDHNSHSQVSNSDEPYIVTPAQLKLENQEADVKYEVDKEGNARSVMDNMDDIPEPVSSIPFTDPERTNKTLPALKKSNLCLDLCLDVSLLVPSPKLGGM